MTKYFQKPFFRKLFLSYTAILLACSLVFSSILFQQILQQERSVQEQQCRSDAQLLMQVVDDKFTEIENIGTQLASAQWFQKVRSQSEILNSSITVLERRDICQELQTYLQHFAGGGQHCPAAPREGAGGGPGLFLGRRAVFFLHAWLEAGLIAGDREGPGGKL